MTFTDVEIPLEPSVRGWEKIPIQECGEKLISVNGISDRLVINPKYFERNIQGARETCYLRLSVVNRLVQVANELPTGWKLVIFDGWRPLEVQKSLFDEYYAKLLCQFPKLSEGDLLQLAKKFVSLPSNDPTKPSPHYTGGAVDLTIRDNEGGDLDMGSGFDDFSDNSKTNFYEIKFINKQLSQKEERFLYNRRFLFELMNKFGFTNYPEEWWHYDYGNQFWAKTKKSTAFYGSVSLDESGDGYGR